MTLAFPHVVVKKIPSKHDAYARYFERAKPRRIELDPDVANLDEQKKLFVVIHELGHWFRFEHVPVREIRQFKSRVDQEEHFAHAFANYFLAPTTLKREQPDDYDLIKRHLTGYRHQILAFARKCIADLKRSTP